MVEAVVDMARLERIMLDLIAEARSSCGLGFGKYPLGLRYAIKRLVPELVSSARVLDAVKDLDERLSRQ